MAYTRIKQGSYLAIIDNQYMVEVKAKNADEAKEGARVAGARAIRGGCKYNLDNIAVCKIPSIICCVDFLK